MAGASKEGSEVPLFGQIRHEFGGPTGTEPLSEAAEAMQANAIILGEKIPPPESIQNVHQVAEALGEIQDYLQAAGLQDDFNYVYWRLSEVIAQSQDEFSRRDALNRTSPIFADNFYIDHIREFTTFHGGDPEALDRIPEGWELGLYDPRLADLPSGLRFVVGMIRHIRAQDLKRSTHLSGAITSPAYKGDYTDIVGEKISQVTKEEAPRLMPGHPALQELFVPLTTGFIAVLRESAWNGSIELSKASTPEEEEALIEQSDRVALRYQETIFRLGSLAFKGASLTEQLGALEAIESLDISKVHRLIPAWMGKAALRGFAVAERTAANTVDNVITAGKKLWKPRDYQAAA